MVVWIHSIVLFTNYDSSCRQKGIAMTKSAVMEPTERIYEEIITRQLGVRDKKLLDRSLSCPGSRKSTHGLGKHCSMSNLRTTDDSDENLYAVVNGDDVEFKKFRDLIEDGCTSSNIYINEKQTDRARSVAQSSETGDDEADVAESNSDCDCASMGRDLKNASRIVRPTFLPIKDSETVYSEILHQTPGSQIDLCPGRVTRESDNPLLRQDVIPSNTPSPSTSMAPSRNGSLRRNDESTRSTSGDSGIQEDLHTLSVYENCARRGGGLHRSQSSPQFYANAASLKSTIDGVYANMESDGKAVPSGDSVYANMDGDMIDSRPRASSRPITIQSNQRKIQSELIYSDLDFEEEPIPESFPSSIGDNSSTSSGLSSATVHLTNFNPPPLPSRPPSVCARRRQTSFSSVSMASSFATNTLRANFIGTHSVHRANKESINSSVKETVHKTNMLDVKSVCVDISKTIVKFCSLSSPYHCVLQFFIDEIHLMDTYSKDERFLGFIVSHPGKEAVCHVFQSDNSAEILGSVKEVFKEMSMRQRLVTSDRPKSYYGEVRNKCQFSQNGVIKIGSLKVKNSLLVINDNIHALLEKVNPKEYYRADLEIRDSSTLVVTSESRLKAEEHSIAWILSLGLYNHDGRYFGYIVSKTKGGKTKMLCHVYKCSTVMMSATIIEAIRSACQNSLALGRTQTPRCSSSMPRSGFRSRLMTSPDTVSRSSTSSDETVRGSSSPGLTHVLDLRQSKPNCVRELSYENDEAEQASVLENLEQGGFPSKEESTTACEDARELGGSIRVQDDTSTEHDSHISSTTEIKNEEAERMEMSDNIDNHLGAESPPASNDIEDGFVVLTPVHQFEHKSNVGEGNVTVENTNEVKYHNDVKENLKEKKSPFSKRKSRIFRGTLIRKKKNSVSKLSASMQSLDLVTREEEETVSPPVKKEHNFVVSYLCSAVVKPPFKSKHVEKCLKQYQKEVGKKQKVGDVCSLGNKLMLQVITDTGATMLDIQNPTSFQRHFPISTIDSFIVHPENADCFAFSTTVPGDEQHKYHLFYKSRDDVATVREAFEQLKKFQRVL